jgi:biotin synthase-related radical SAM superfamily protein
MSKVAVVVGPGHLRSVVSQTCHYQQIGKACKFCAVQYWWNAAPAKQPLQIADAVEAAVEEGVAKHISITTATLNTPDKGLQQLVETAGLIHERADIPIMLEFEPVVDLKLFRSILKRARDYGVTTVSLNIECFDESLREEIMPAKGKIPVEVYLENCRVSSISMGERGFSQRSWYASGNDDSIFKRRRDISAAGVMTFLVPHSPAAGAEYADFTPPSAERMLYLYEKASEIHQRYGLDLYACTAGCVKGGGFSGIKDVARFGA